MPNPDLKTGLAKAFRKRMTPAERHLWQRLRARRLFGLKFQRQEPIGPYIVDFYCSTARLAIELDGDAHYLTSRNDAIRQKYLEDEGLSVLRFPNFEALQNTGVVIQRILESCLGHLGVVDSDVAVQQDLSSKKEGTV